MSISDILATVAVFIIGGAVLLSGLYSISHWINILEGLK